MASTRPSYSVTVTGGISSLVAQKMRQYQRLMRRRGVEHYTADEIEALRTLLESSPGVRAVSCIERHPRGGYRTQFELSPEFIDAFIERLEAHDWMSVV